MSKYMIRPISEQDIPFLWDMLYESLYTPEGQERLSKEVINNPSLSKYVEGWGRNGDFGFIAMNNAGEPVGSITIRYFNKDNRGYGYINDETPELGMAVLSQYRGQGVGTALIKILLEHAGAAGIKAVSLSVDPNNPAMNLYKRFGFQEVGIEETSVTMISKL